MNVIGDGHEAEREVGLEGFLSLLSFVLRIWFCCACMSIVVKTLRRLLGSGTNPLIGLSKQPGTSFGYW